MFRSRAHSTTASTCRISARQDGVIDDAFNALIRDDATRLLGAVNV
ncbi:hypothetical protein [Ruegeria lacuscaerulensis]|nr:hypothetical protein [Ruegeria lacuscaerulensis]